MSDGVHTDVNRRHDFVLLFDVTDGNPNGDPDAGNLPRVDPETMQGIVTDVCLKRKVRNYVDTTRGNEGRFKIYVQNKGIALNTLHQRAYAELNVKSTGSKQKRADIDKVNQWMRENFYGHSDLRCRHDYRGELRSGPRPDAVDLRALDRPGGAARCLHHPRGDHSRRRC